MMAIRCYIKKDDKVKVIAGKDKGKKGSVLRVLPKDDRAIVQGVNMVQRHQRQTAAQEGGIIAKEASIHLSNLAIADPKTGKPLDPRRWASHLGGGVTKRQQQHTRAVHSRQQATLHAELDPAQPLMIKQASGPEAAAAFQHAPDSEAPLPDAHFTLGGEAALALLQPGGRGRPVPTPGQGRHRV